MAQIMVVGIGLSFAPFSAAERLEPRAKYQIDASQFGVSVANPNNRDALQSFLNYLAQTGYVGTVAPGIYEVEGGLSVLPEGSVTIKGSGKGQTIITGKGKNFLQSRGDIVLSDLSVKGFDFHIVSMQAGNINISNCSFEQGKGFLKGTIEAESLSITDCVIKDFSSFGLFPGKSVITKAAVFARNHVRNIARYLYRLSHEAPLFFESNNIDGITAGRFTGNAGVARVILRGGSTTYIRNNIIKNVIASDASATLLYWSGVNAVITGNTFGKFASAKRAVLVHEKDSSSKYLVLSDNIFLGGDDLAEFDAVIYALTGLKENPSPKIIERNKGPHLRGKLVQIFHQKHHQKPPGNFTIRQNQFQKLDAPSLVSILHGASDLLITDNIIENMSNPYSMSITGSAIVKCLVGVSITSEHGIIKNIRSRNNSITFSQDGEKKSRSSSLFFMRIFSKGRPQEGVWTSDGDEIVNSNNILSLASLPSGHFRLNNIKVRGLSGNPVIGTATSYQSLN